MAIHKGQIWCLPQDSKPSPTRSGGGGVLAYITVSNVVISLFCLFMVKASAMGAQAAGHPVCVVQPLLGEISQETVELDRVEITSRALSHYFVLGPLFFRISTRLCTFYCNSVNSNS